MKITKFFALLCAATVGFTACETENGNTGNEGNQPQNPTEAEGSIKIKADKTAIELGDAINFTVTDSAGQDVTSLASIYDQDMNSIPAKFTPETTGTYTFNATIGAENSNYITVVVLETLPEIPADPQPENLSFNHRVVIIDHTGVNCGYCPDVTDLLIAMEKNAEWYKHYTEVTCHAGYYASGDPANSAAANALNKVHSVTGYPDVRCNIHGGKLGNRTTAAFVNLLKNNVKTDGADVGIALAVEGDASNIFCAAQVKVKEAKEYQVVAWLLENNIYSPNQSGASKDVHRIYNYALRNISGDYSKSVLGTSVGVLEEGQVYDCGFVLPITSTKWKSENMGVLVIVSAKDANGRWDVVNSAYCKLNESKTFEYNE